MQSYYNNIIFEAGFNQWQYFWYLPEQSYFLKK